MKNRELLLWRGVWLPLAVGLTVCSTGDRQPATGSDLSSFALDAPVRGRVVANETACVVDAQCRLRIELADTTVDVLYGTGERPAPECEISREVSDAAFAVAPDDAVQAVMSSCGEEGLFLRALERLGG